MRHMYRTVTRFIMPRPYKRRVRCREAAGRHATAAVEGLLGDGLWETGHWQSRAKFRRIDPVHGDRMPTFDSKKLAALFEKYREEDEDIIGPDGLQKMYEEMQVDLDDIVTLVFAWRLGAERLCEFTRAEFVGGLQRLRIDNLQTLRRKLDEMRSCIDTDESFRTFYLWCFDYYKGSALKSMDLEMAKELWKQILATRYRHLDLWVEFLDTKRNVITRDTYTLFLSFTKNCKDDFSDYDEAAAWPVLIDEFVEYAKGRV